jgi:predicted enzyme involved in methoxymalonyl-ACP biosynthesis
MMSEIPTSEKLAQALEVAGAPQEMITKARSKHYDEYESDLMSPIRQLAADAAEHGLDEIALRAMNGDFDGQKWEAEQWARSPEGKETFAQFGGSLKQKKRR